MRFCKAILGIFSLSYSILGIGMVKYHNDNKEIPIYKVCEPESVSTTDIASLLIFQILIKNKFLQEHQLDHCETYVSLFRNLN